MDRLHPSVVVPYVDDPIAGHDPEFLQHAMDYTRDVVPVNVERVSVCFARIHFCEALVSD